MHSSGYVEASLYHRVNDTGQIKIRLFVVSRISGRLPQNKINHQFKSELDDKDLADPVCYLPGQIDVLVCAGVWTAVALSGIHRKQADNSLWLAQNTSLGWMVFGDVRNNATKCPYVFHMHQVDQTNMLIERFWEIESVPSIRTRSSDEQWAEDNFLRTFSRDSNGRYSVFSI